MADAVTIYNSARASKSHTRGHTGNAAVCAQEKRTDGPTEATVRGKQGLADAVEQLSSQREGKTFPTGT